MSPHIGETLDLEMPVSLSKALTSSSTLRVESPSIQEEQITERNALSALRHGLSRGKRTSPHAVWGSRARAVRPDGEGLGRGTVAAGDALLATLITFGDDPGFGPGLDEVLQAGPQKTPWQLLANELRSQQEVPSIG